MTTNIGADKVTSPTPMGFITPTEEEKKEMGSSKALEELKLSPKEASGRMEKLLLSALANWEAKNEGKRMDGCN